MIDCTSSKNFSWTESKSKDSFHVTQRPIFFPKDYPQANCSLLTFSYTVARQNRCVRSGCCHSLALLIRGTLSYRRNDLKEFLNVGGETMPTWSIFSTALMTGMGTMAVPGLSFCKIPPKKFALDSKIKHLNNTSTSFCTHCCHQGLTVI